jgi:peptidoglycan/LPS O-acetylase OafA/YrhL
MEEFNHLVFFDPLSPIYFFIIFVIAILTSKLLLIFFQKNANQPTNQFTTLDGLRGILGISVFLHHNAIWEQYIKYSKWAVPESNLYTHLGHSSVAMFFMITSFLFTNKLLKNPEVDWRKLFVGRLFRIMPMYYVSCLLIILIVYFISDFQFLGSLRQILESYFCILSCNLLSEPIFNSFTESSIVNAGVFWSLAYEWIFYLSLPLTYLLLYKRLPNLFYLIFALISVLIFIYFRGLSLIHIYSFSGGAMTAILRNRTKFEKVIDKNRLAVDVLLLLFLIAILQFENAYSFFSISILIICFFFISNGASLFGVLKMRSLKLLGDICFSIYLLHGIILFITFYFIVGVNETKAFSLSQYSLIGIVITPILVLLSFISFKFIEEPALNYYRKKIA